MNTKNYECLGTDQLQHIMHVIRMRLVDSLRDPSIRMKSPLPRGSYFQGVACLGICGWHGTRTGLAVALCSYSEVPWTGDILHRKRRSGHWCQSQNRPSGGRQGVLLCKSEDWNWISCLLYQDLGRISWAPKQCNCPGAEAVWEQMLGNETMG